MEQTAGERTEMQGYLQTSTSANLRMLPLKMEAVRIRTQCSELGVGGLFQNTHHKALSAHSKSTGQRVEKKKKRRKVRRERSSCQQWGGPGMGVCWPFLTRSPSSPHHPTRRFGLEFFFFSTSSSPLGGFQRRSEGDSTCEERKGEWEIKTKQNESKSCSKLPNSFHRPGVSEKAHKFGLRS